jgi:hypothetical protein
MATRCIESGGDTPTKFKFNPVGQLEWPSAVRTFNSREQSVGTAWTAIP